MKVKTEGGVRCNIGIAEYIEDNLEPNGYSFPGSLECVEERARANSRALGELCEILTEKFHLLDAADLQKISGSISEIGLGLLGGTSG